MDLDKGLKKDCQWQENKNSCLGVVREGKYHNPYLDSKTLDSPTDEMSQLGSVHKKLYT